MRLLSPPLTLILLASLLPAAAPAEQEVVARLVRHQPRVEATPPGAPISPGADIRKGTEVSTGKKAGALIAVGFQSPVRGSLKLWPESSVRFTQGIVNAATGREVSYFVKLGTLLAVFAKSRIEVEPGVEAEKWIETPAAKIRLYGTMVSVQVEPDGTTSVLVLEGSATVEGNASGKVKLAAGTRTTVRLGQPPTLPAPVDPTSTLGALDLRPSLPSFRDAPLLDLHDLNLDLPKVARP